MLVCVCVYLTQSLFQVDEGKYLKIKTADRKLPKLEKLPRPRYLGKGSRPGGKGLRARGRSPPSWHHVQEDTVSGGLALTVKVLPLGQPSNPECSSCALLKAGGAGGGLSCGMASCAPYR